jgi:transcriptional regulator GlxA family with amidase domain
MPYCKQTAFTTAAALAALVALGCGSLPVSADSTSRPLRIPSDRPLRAGFLIVDGVYNTELTAPYDVFQHTVAHTSPAPGIEVFTVSPDGRQVTTAEGLRIVPHYSFETAPPIDILVVPSGEHSRDSDRQNRDLIEWVSKTGAQAQFVVSLCWGAFILAEAGLLDDHSCTTFPGDYRPFAEAFPDLDLRINVTFVHDGRVLTSEGGAHSYDVAMYLVDLLFGEEVARGIGKGLLIPWPPTGEARPAYVTDPGMSLERATE